MNVLVDSNILIYASKSTDSSPAVSASHLWKPSVSPALSA